MSGDSRLELQQAIVQALLAHAGVTAVVGSDGVYDDVPENAAELGLFPYLVIGEMSASDASDKVEDGVDVSLKLWAWSSYRGYKEVYQALAAAYDVLHNGSYSVSGHTVVFSQFRTSEVGRDKDGVLRFGIARYEIETCPTV